MDGSFAAVADTLAVLAGQYADCRARHAALIEAIRVQTDDAP
jgi:hypothetical protein